MIDPKDKVQILEIAKKYQVKKVFLFGSSLEKGDDSSDIDLAVEGIQDSLFLKFYSELIFKLSKPVDLVDLKKKSKFTDLIKSESVALN